MKKSILLMMLAILSMGSNLKADSNLEKSRGLMVAENPEEHIFVAVNSSYGKISYEPVYGYGNLFRCLKEYDKSEGSILQSFAEDLIKVPKMKEEIRIKALSILDKQTEEVCGKDYQEIEEDPTVLSGLNYLANEQYNRLSTFVPIENIKSIIDNKNNSLSICLSDLVFVEYINQVAAKCLK